MTVPGECLPAILVWFLASAPPAFAQDYVDPVTCKPCHQRLYDEYAATPLGRSFYSAGPKSLLEDWDVNNKFYHAPSESYFEMLRRGESFNIRRYQVEGGREVNSLELRVTHIMGSGTRARSYLHQTPEGRLIELPVSWYSQEQRWAMAPGYDRPKHAGFTRTVNHKCLRALELDPALVQAENKLGNLLAESARTDEALKHYRRALELDAGFADVHLNLGLTLRGLGDLPAAEEAFRQAIKADPLYAPGYRDLGSLLLVQGKIDAASSVLERSLAIDPADAKTHNNLGLALLALGKREEGIGHLRFALRHGAESDRELTRRTLQSIGIEAP